MGYVISCNKLEVKMNAIYRSMLVWFIVACFNLPLQAQQSSTTIQLQGSPELQQNIINGQKIVEDWLALIDQGNYGASWDAASKKFQLTIPRAEWIKVVDSWRKPLGGLVSRQIADIKVAENPPNMPSGAYLVYVYQTAFRNKASVTELAIIFQTDAGDWKILSYHLK